MSFLDKLSKAQYSANSLLCVGLDPDLTKLPHSFRTAPEEVAVREFCLSIIDATAPYAAAFKPNLAFFEALGAKGWSVLADVIKAVPKDRIVVADGKRGDIGNTARRYASALYDRLGCEACTVAPYMGEDAIIPFMEDSDRCAFVLVATSNPSGATLQQLEFDRERLYQRVARMATNAAMNQVGDVGFVVGATRPKMLADLRAAYPTIPFLVPGVGAQGGSVVDVLEANSGGPILINSSRSILYASNEDDFAGAAADAALRLAKQMPYPN